MARFHLAFFALAIAIQSALGAPMGDSAKELAEKAKNAQFFSEVYAMPGMSGSLNPYEERARKAENDARSEHLGAVARRLELASHRAQFNEDQKRMGIDKRIQEESDKYAQ